MGQKTHPFGFRLGITEHHLSQWYSKSTQYSNFVREDYLVRKYLIEQLSGSIVSGSSLQNKSAPRTDAGLAKTLLSRHGDRLRVEVHVAQPKVVTGEAGSRLKELTQGLITLLAEPRKAGNHPKSNLISLSSPSNRKPPEFTKAENNQTKSGGEAQLTVSAELTKSVGVTPSYSTESLAKPTPISTTNPNAISLHVIQIADPRIDATVLAQRVAQQLERRIAYRRVMKQSIKEACEAGVEGIKIEISGRLNGAEIARSETIKEGTLPLHTLRARIDYCSHRAETIYGTLGIKVWIHTKKSL